MAGKRSATSELNADNWDQEEDQEDAGVFKRASEDVLSRRVVKTARRRVPAADSSTKSAFGGFAGFKTASAPATTAFSFLKSNSDSSAVTSTSSSFITNKTPTTNGSTKVSENGISISVTPASSSSSMSKDVKASKSESTSKESSSPKKPREYFSKLKGLNQSVANWIKSHVDSNPVCILTPIFRDYEKYLKEIEAKHGKELETPKSTETKQEIKLEPKPIEKVETLSSTEKKKENFIFASSTAKSSTEGTSDNWKPEKSIFGSSSAVGKSIFSSSASNKTENKSPFGVSSTITSDVKINFLSKPSSESKDEEPKKSEEKSPAKLSFTQTSGSLSGGSFSFGQSSSASATGAGFSFGGAKPFTFGGAAVQKPPETEEKASTEENDEDEPPKPDFKPVTEEGSVFEQKCKVFVKRDSSYSDRGVGTLFLKPAPNDKMQLIVRAVNSLGNLLLNTLLTESIPIKRLNKTNIMLVCLPLPTAEPPPVPTLLRVKTPEEADLLFETLEKYKK